jgi:ribosomal protein S18 acetylase RimI-like enzyme
MVLPAGHTARAPRADDADVQALYELVRDYTAEVTGVADYTVDDARDELTEHGFDPELDGRFVLDADGRLAGNAFVHRKGDSDLVDIDVVAPGDEVRRWLTGWALDRAAEAGRAAGHGEITVGHGCYRTDAPLRETLAAHGFHIATTYHRMRIDHAGPYPAPAPPDGVVLRVDGDDDGLRRAAHEVYTTAFAEHFGFTAESYEDWAERRERRPAFTWSKLWLAELDGSPVGVLECDDRFAEEGSGYVPELGVVPSARGRGIAKFLLRHAFAVDAAAGRTGTLLHVDTDNVTPALDLYESVGMRAVLVIDAWRRVLQT